MALAIVQLPVQNITGAGMPACMIQLVAVVISSVYAELMVGRGIGMDHHAKMM